LRQVQRPATVLDSKENEEVFLILHSNFNFKLIIRFRITDYRLPMNAQRHVVRLRAFSNMPFRQ
jgi:hypothetical protein